MYLYNIIFIYVYLIYHIYIYFPLDLVSHFKIKDVDHITQYFTYSNILWFSEITPLRIHQGDPNSTAPQFQLTELLFNATLRFEIITESQAVVRTNSERPEYTLLSFPQ